jgi:hypothetical protein
MTQAYEQPAQLSTRFRWRAALGITLAIPVVGVVVMALLAMGVADPPRSDPLQWQTQSLAGWTSTGEGDYRQNAAPVMLPSAAFTLEISAVNTGPPDSAWGVYFDAEPPLFFLVDNQGYFSATETLAEPDWRPFIHICPNTLNKLYILRESNGTLILRINDEIAWADTTQDVAAHPWGIIQYRQAAVAWDSIDLYHE